VEGQCSTVPLVLGLTCRALHEATGIYFKSKILNGELNVNFTKHRHQL